MLSNNFIQEFVKELTVPKVYGQCVIDGDCPFRSMMGVEDKKHIRGEGKVMKPENISSASNNFLILDKRVKTESKVPKTIKGDGKLGGGGPGLEKVEEEATMKA